MSTISSSNNKSRKSNDYFYSIFGCCSINTVDADVFTDPQRSNNSSVGLSLYPSSISNDNTKESQLNDKNINNNDNIEDNNYNVKDKKSITRALPTQWKQETHYDDGENETPISSNKKVSTSLSVNPLLPSHQILQSVKDIPPVRFEEPSAILSIDQATSLQYYLPTTLQGHIWTKIYSLTKDGASLERLLTNIENIEQILFVIQDNKGSIFGGYFHDSFKRKENYYGTRHSWLFTFENRKNLDTIRYTIGKSIKHQQLQQQSMENINLSIPITTYGDNIEQQTVRSISTIIHSTSLSSENNDINQLTLRSYNSRNSSNQHSLRSTNKDLFSSDLSNKHIQQNSNSTNSSIWTISNKNLQTISGGIFLSSLLSSSSLATMDIHENDDINIQTLPDVHIYKATIKNNLYHYIKLNIHSIPTALYIGGGNEGVPAIYIDEYMEHCTTGANATYLSPPLAYKEEQETNKDNVNKNNDNNDIPNSSMITTLSLDQPTTESNTTAIPTLHDLGKEIDFIPINIEVYSFNKILLKEKDILYRDNSNSHTIHNTSNSKLHHGIIEAKKEGIGTLGVVGTLLERPGEEHED